MLNSVARFRAAGVDTKSRRGLAASAARTARRWFLIVAPIAAGALAIVGAAADPAVGESGRPLYEAYASDPDGVQVKAFGYHFGYALWGAAALLLAGLIRARGSWIANVAGILALLGLTTMPGFILADFYDSAIGQVSGVDAAVAVEDRMEGMWALVVIAASGTIGFMLSLPVAALAAWRAGLIRWWAVLAAVAAIVGGFGVLGASVSGTVVLAAGFVVLSISLARIDPHVWGVVAQADDPRPTLTP